MRPLPPHSAKVRLRPTGGPAIQFHAIRPPSSGEHPVRLEPSLVFQGFFVRPPNHLSPIARAPSDSFAIRTAPASSKRFTTVASPSNLCCLNPPEPQVVG